MNKEYNVFLNIKIKLQFSNFQNTGLHVCFDSFSAAFICIINIGKIPKGIVFRFQLFSHSN